MTHRHHGSPLTGSRPSARARPRRRTLGVRADPQGVADRVVALPYAGRRSPSTRLFESTDAKLGDGSEPFRDPDRCARSLVADTGGLPRALEIDAKLSSRGLGLVDGMVAAIAERRGMLRVLTTDRRHPAAVRVGARHSRAPELIR